MSTISNKKILSLVAALLVAHSPSSAAGIRGLQSNRQQQDERGLSKGKGRPIHDPNATARYYNPNTNSVEVPQSALEARGRGKGKVAGANHNPHARSSNANTRTATINSATTDSNLGNEANLRGGGHNIGMEVVGGQHSESTGHFAPVSFCPFDAPEANDSCYLEGYDYLECYYPRMICACRKGNPFFTCEEYIPNAN